MYTLRSAQNMAPCDLCNNQISAPSSKFCVKCLAHIDDDRAALEVLFAEKIISLRPDALNFFREARLRAMTRFVSDIINALRSGEQSGITISEFVNILKKKYSDISPEEERKLAEALEGGIKRIIENNIEKYEAPSENGDNYGHLISAPLAADSRVTGKIMDMAKESTSNFLALIAPTFCKDSLENTYTDARAHVDDFFNETPSGHITFDYLKAKSLGRSSGTSDSLLYNYFVGETATLDINKNGFPASIDVQNNTPMPDRILMLCQLAYKLAQDAGLKKQDFNNDAKLLKTAITMYSKARKQTLHVASYIEHVNEGVGGAYNRNLNLIRVHGNFSDFLRDYSTHVPEILTHEMSHALERVAIPNMVRKGSKNYTLLDASAAVLYDNAKSTDLVLAEEFPNISLILKNVTFPFRYIGRLYMNNDRTQIEATEALSNGIGFFFSADSIVPAFKSNTEIMSHALAVFYGEYVVK